jgi:uncharacterized membrane protein SpoIIM required for sporulation
MRETKFIEQNKEKWAEYESMLEEKNRDPRRLNDLFVQITDDLSYARTFYPNRSVRLYLNGLAQGIFHNIFRGRRFPKERFWHFWADELPQVVWQSRRALLLSLAIFLLAFGIGVLSSIINPDFARVVLGDSYVNMTLDNIESNDPMRVYKESRPMGMSLGIAANNLFVALRTAIFGVFASIGTLFIMLYNGIMVGAFQYFFIERGLFWESFLTIWIHGTLEISAIIIAGGAGLMAGSGLLFPGTYTRLQAFQLSMRKGLKIFIGITPIIILAAFFEGFLTRFTEVSPIIRGLFILTSFVFVVYYFVWLPWYKAKTSTFRTMAPDEVLPDSRDGIRGDTIKNAGEVLADAFYLYKNNLTLSLWSTTGVTVTLLLAHYFFRENPFESQVHLFDYSRDTALMRITNLFNGNNVLFNTFHVGLLVILASVAFLLIERHLWPNDVSALTEWPHGLWMVFKMLIPALLICFLFLVSHVSLWIVGVFVFPWLALWLAAAFFDRRNGFNTAFVAVEHYFRQFGQAFLLGLLLCSLGALLFFFLSSTIGSMLIDFVGMLAPPAEGSLFNLKRAFAYFLSGFIFFNLLFLMFLAGGIQFFSAREINEAASLEAMIPTIGQQKQIRGLAKE